MTAVNDKPAVKRVQINFIHTHVSSSETRNVDAAATAKTMTDGFTATLYGLTVRLTTTPHIYTANDN